MEISGKVALVTGGASGLGAATIRAFHAKGAKVVILDRNVDAGTSLATELGASALFVETDVASAASAENAVAKATEAFGGVNILVNCAGVGTAGRVVGKNGPQPLDQFETVIRINLVGSFNLIRVAGAAMQKNAPDAGGERGVIVNTASVAAFDGQIGQAAYAASKGGIVGMTLPIAREFASHGIRVCTIAPGIFETPMLAALPEPVKASLGQQVPFPSRLGKPSEYASLALHIAENTMLNGEVIRLDGAIRMAPK